MDKLISRADQIDKQQQSLLLTIQQLGISPSTTSNIPENIRTTLLKNLKTLRNQIISLQNENKSLKSKISLLEKQRINDMKIYTKMEKEIQFIKKNYMISMAKLTPNDFRHSITEYLIKIKNELINYKKNDKLGEIESELITLKNDTNVKLLEYDKYVENEKRLIEWRNGLRDKLVSLKNEISCINDGGNGNLIPEKFQNELVSRLKKIRGEVFMIENENTSLKMQVNKIDPLMSLKYDVFITTIDMHCGGEPLRIIDNNCGLPILKSNTILDKRNEMLNSYDFYRKILMNEPHGHSNMYGCIIVDSKLADFGVLFMHNSGYSTNCGHAIMCLTRYAVDFNKVKVMQSDIKQGYKIMKIETPSGVITSKCMLNKKGKSTLNVSFNSAPGWSVLTNYKLVLNEKETIILDISYGGAYYALVNINQFNYLSLKNVDINKIIAKAVEIKSKLIENKIESQFKNPDGNDLKFLYGIIFIDDNNKPSNNICIFGEKQVDRCPTGSGVIARLANEFEKKENEINGEYKQFISVTGSLFKGKIIDKINYKNIENAVIIEVNGTSFYCGRNQIYCEDGDQLGRGFLID